MCQMQGNQKQNVTLQEQRLGYVFHISCLCITGTEGFGCRVRSQSPSAAPCGFAVVMRALSLKGQIINYSKFAKRLPFCFLKRHFLLREGK